MSYWVYLEETIKKSVLGQKVKIHNCVAVDKHSEGGTHVLGGTSEAELNITYNYGIFYRQSLDEEGLGWLHGKKAKDVIERLEKAVKELGTERDSDSDYWKATKGNAGYALQILLEWARQYPEAVFRVH